jgi:hypothetical protein
LQTSLRARTDPNEHGDGTCRIARTPRDAPTSGWLNVAKRVKDDVAADLSP